MYFSKFPTTYYTLDDKQTVQIVRNIFIRLVVNDNIKNNYSLYDEYDILEGDTPEILAEKMYGSSTLHWLILHYNEIIDPRYDWPLTSNNLVKYCQSKYANIYDTHHYEDVDGNWVNSNYPGATSISNYEYEDRINESKRRIRLLKPQYVEAVTREFYTKLENINV